VAWQVKVNSMPAKGFLSAYDIMKLSSFDTPPPGDASNPALSVSLAARPSSTQWGAPPSGTRSAASAAMPHAASHGLHGAREAPVTMAQGAPGTGLESPVEHNTSLRKADDEQEASVGSITSAAESLTRMLDGDDVYSSSRLQGGASMLPPAWEDLLHIVAELPLFSQTAGMHEALPADKPPQTTIGLMVKPDPDNGGLGIVTGCVEGSSSDLSGELMVGDVVLAVDGTPFNHPDAMKKMRGGQAIVSAGTQMNLTLERHGTGVFECAFVREPYANVLLKRELFELLSQFKESLGLLSNYSSDSPIRTNGDPQSRYIFQAVRAKLVELEKSNMISLCVLRSELQGLQQVMEQIIKYIKRATTEGDETIRSLTGRIENQEEQIAQLSLRVNSLVAQGGGASNDQEQIVGEEHESHEQMHLLRHECNRLRNTVQSKESELEGLRERFDQMLDEQGLRDSSEDRSLGNQSPKKEHQEQLQMILSQNLQTGEPSDQDAIEIELQSVQAQLEQERDTNNLSMAALKRDLWVSVIRRWLNNCCRRVITSWRIELGRKQYYRVVCDKIENNCRLRCNRRRLKTAFSSFTTMWFESKRLRHAGVTAASGWLFLGVRKHLQAWLARVDWKAYAQRFESKAKAKSVARVFHSWSRIAAHCPPGLDSEMVATIMSPQSTNASPTSPRSAQIMADAKATLNDAAKVNARAQAIQKSKPAVVDKGMQSLRWQSDASVQCTIASLIDAVVGQADAHDVNHSQSLPNSPLKLCTHASQQTSPLQPEAVSMTVCTSTGSQCDSMPGKEREPSLSATKQPSARSQQESTFIFRSMHEKFATEHKELLRLRESLAAAQETIKRQEDFLKSAQDSDRRLKESLQMAHAQLHRSCKDAGEDRRRAAQLGQELEQVERKLLMSQEERDELRIIVSDERRINARSNVGIFAALSNPLVSTIAKRPSIPESGQVMHQNHTHTALVAATASRSVPESKPQPANMVCLCVLCGSSVRIFV
jgi:hypothetical protein